jgi:hypothetical protein
MHVARTVRRRPLGGVVGMPEVSTERLDGLNDHQLKIQPTRKPFPHRGPLGRPFVPHPGDMRGQCRGVDLMLQGALRLLHGGCAKDVLQLLVHLTHRAGGGCRQHVQERGCWDHVLVGLGKGGEQPLCPLHHRDLVCLKRQFTLVQVGQPGLNNRPLIDELTSLPCSISLDVILQGALPFLPVSHQLFGEGCWCGGPLQPRRCGLKCRGLLRLRCSCDGGGIHHRVARPRERGVGTLPLAQDRISLTGRFLEDGMHRR